MREKMMINELLGTWLDSTVSGARMCGRSTPTCVLKRSGRKTLRSLRCVHIIRRLSNDSSDPCVKCFSRPQDAFSSLFLACLLMRTLQQRRIWLTRILLAIRLHGTRGPCSPMLGPARLIAWSGSISALTGPGNCCRRRRRRRRRSTSTCWSCTSLIWTSQPRSRPPKPEGSNGAPSGRGQWAWRQRCSSTRGTTIWVMACQRRRALQAAIPVEPSRLSLLLLPSLLPSLLLRHHPSYSLSQRRQLSPGLHQQRDLP